jgi:CrcB protein
MAAVEGAQAAVRPRFSPVAVGLVVIGGTLGTAAREALTLAFPPIDGVPYVTVVINVVGAFALGVLIETLVRRGPEHDARRNWRLLVGTGVLGGFTTYSALASDAFLLLHDGATSAALWYAFGTVALGALASWTGIAVAARRNAAPEGEQS